MNVLRTIRKLHKMPLREVQGRVAERWHGRAERRQHRRGPASSSSLGIDGGVAEHLAARAAEMVPGSRPGEITALERSYPNVHELLRARAIRRGDAILDGTHTLLGEAVDLTGAVDWHRDPKNGHCWDRNFYADLHVYQSHSGVDVKYVWELNRHQFLVELGQAWLLTGRDRYATRVRELLLDWIQENPLYEGVNWTSALEPAVRSISWLWTLAALAEWPGWRANDRTLLARSLAEHATYLRHHLSLFSSPYNHLIGEATALFLLGRWLRGSQAAARWEQQGRTVLSQFGLRQFCRDGFSVEQATGYHFFTAGFLLHAVCVARCFGAPLEDVESVVAKALRAAGSLQQPDGTWPAIGDLDSARSIPVYPDDFWDFRSFCSLGAVLCDLPQLKETADSAGKELYWLLGVEGLRAWDRLPEKRRPPGTVLKESGYVVAASDRREPADWLMLDAGPLAHGVYPDATPSVAHGHADALQVLLFQQGRPVLVDSGMPCYSGSRQWVDHFRGPSAHNTLEVEGTPWVRSCGRLEWSHLAGTPTLEANVSADVWLIRGRLSLDARTTMERNVLGLPGLGVWIADLVRSGVPCRVSWYWQMLPSARPCLVQQEPCRSEVAFDTGVLATATTGNALQVAVQSASADGPAAWQAPGYGVLTEGFRIVHGAAAASGLLTVTFLGPKVIPCCVQVGNRRVSLALDGDSDPWSSSESIDAEVLWQVETRDGPAQFAAGVSAVAGQTAWKPLEGAGGWSAAQMQPAVAFAHGRNTQ